jgi:hypothetical protein
MRKNRTSKLWEYLHACGVLENGSDAEIKEAKRTYRKNYFLEYKRKARIDKPEYIISFSKKNGEIEKVLKASKKHGLKPSTFIHQAVLAYINQRFLVPHPSQIALLEQLLSECLNEIKLIVKIKERHFWQYDEKIEKIEKRITLLEQDISNVLRNPILISNDYKNQIV